MSDELDLLIVGSGVAGLSAAVRAAERHDLRVGVLTKGELDQTATRWAQGGVAAVLRSDPDSTDLHLADTLRAGADLCDEDAVRVLVDEGPRRVTELVALGAVFDVGPDGDYVLAREGGHSLPRILSAGGAATGVEVERALVEAARASATALFERTFAAEVLLDGRECAGVRAVGDDGTVRDVAARHVLLAAGGAGQMFAVTTNPAVATGDGMAMAARAGAALADLEFVQFHPTALYVPESPRPLMSEALRGHGALLRDARGERFVDELAARDHVARAITAAIADQDLPHVWLDLTPVDGFGERFPTLRAELVRAGIDPDRGEWVPVAPAAHYCCGGVLTDLDGASTVPGLWAAGEVASAGVHGANRLASNSLLDGMVFGTRVVEAVSAGRRGPSPTGAMTGVLGVDERPRAVGTRVVRADRHLLAGRGGASIGAAGDGSDPPAGALERLRTTMTRRAGVLRDEGSLAEAAAVVAELRGGFGPVSAPSVAERELVNLCEVAALTLVAAGARTETRGAHTRTDHPGTDPDLRTRIVITP